MAKDMDQHVADRSAYNLGETCALSSNQQHAVLPSSKEQILENSPTEEEKCKLASLKVGDVMLVTGTRLRSKGLVTAQKIKYLKARSSHVLFSLSSGVFIHATGDNGVHLVSIFDEITEIEADWRVIRFNSLNPELEEPLNKSALYYFSQAYNPDFLGGEKPDASFCSELVAKIFARAGTDLFEGRATSEVWPADFDRAADEATEWEDVTNEYKDALPVLKKYEFFHRHGLQTISAVLTRRAIFNPLRKLMADTLVAAADPDRAPKLRAELDALFEDMESRRSIQRWDGS